MTDHRSPDEDELVSRVLDGDANDEDRARVAHDPRLRARVQDFERVRAAVADVEPAPPAAREAAIAAALAEAAPATAADDPVSADMLAYVRDRRRRRAATVVAVAAALLIGVPLLAIAFTGRGTERESASTAGVEATADAPSETLAPPFAGVDDATGYAGDLGTLDTTAQLQAAVALALTSASASSANDTAESQLALPPATAPADSAARTSSSILGSIQTPEVAQACISYLAAAEPALGTAALTAAATWQGFPALVVVYRGAADTIVVVTDGCRVVARVPA